MCKESWPPSLGDVGWFCAQQMAWVGMWLGQLLSSEIAIINIGAEKKRILIIIIIPVLQKAVGFRMGRTSLCRYFNGCCQGEMV